MTSASGFDFGDPITLVLSILGIIVIVAAAAAVARASFVKAQLDALRGDRDDLVARVNILEDENIRISTELKAETVRREALEKVVTAKEQIDAVSLMLKKHDDRAQRMERLLIPIGRKLLGPGEVTYDGQ